MRNHRIVAPLFLFMAIVISSTMLWGQQARPPAAVQKAAQSLVMVHAGEYGGSGTVINTTSTKYAGTKIIITAKHVVIDRLKNVSVEFQGSAQRYPATVIGVHPTADVAAIQMKGGPEVPGVFIAPSQEGQLWYLGFSFRGPLAFTGWVTMSQDTWAEVIGNSIEGMSGTGAFNAKGDYVSDVYARTAAGPKRMIMATNRSVRGLCYKLFGTVFARQTAERVQFPEYMVPGQEYPAAQAYGVRKLQPIGGCNGQQCQPYQQPRMNPPQALPYPPQQQLPPGFQAIDVQPIRPQKPPQQVPITIDYEKLAAAMPKPQDGKPGRDGKDGINGKDGERGPPGPEGQPGRDGQNATVDEDAIVKRVLEQIPYEQLGSEIGQQVYGQIKNDPQFKIDEDKLLARLKAQLPSITVEVETPNGIARRVQDLSQGDARFRFKFDAGQFGVRQ
jgi:hypothetical protein